MKKSTRFCLYFPQSKIAFPCKCHNQPVFNKESQDKTFFLINSEIIYLSCFFSMLPERSGTSGTVSFCSASRTKSIWLRDDRVWLDNFFLPPRCDRSDTGAGERHPVEKTLWALPPLPHPRQSTCVSAVFECEGLKECFINEAERFLVWVWVWHGVSHTQTQISCIFSHHFSSC